MKVVCTTCCYRGLPSDELTETLQGAPQAGYRYIDVHFVTLSDDRDAAHAYGEEVRESCLAHSLEPVGIYCEGFGGRDAAHLEQQMQRIRRRISFAMGLGVDRVVGSGAHPRGDGPLANVIACLHALEDTITGTPIKIGVEPHAGSVIEQISDYDAIFSEIDHPQICICPDIGHFHAAGVDVYRLLEQYPARIYHTHIKDHRGRQSVGIGRGEIDISRFIRTLAQLGYDGCLAVELEHLDKEHTQQYVTEARVRLEQELGSLG